MTRTLFSAGLNWRVIDTKWQNFLKAFNDFSIKKISKFGDSQIARLMNDQGIVRNEAKIRSMIYNAQQALQLEKEFGSFREYIKSFGKKHDALQADLQSRFHHLGESSSRTFLWMAGLDLKPTAEEKKWLAKNK